MSPDHSRTKRGAAERPMPPVRTLRGDIPAPVAPAGAWIAPVRSGVGRPPVPPEPTRAPEQPAVEAVPGLQPLAQPVASEESELPIGTWTDIADDAGAELVLEDEIWVSDRDAVVESLEHGGTVEPLEGLTVAGDVARTQPEPALDEPPVKAWDLTAARPASEGETNDQDDWERSGWEVLSRAFPESTAEPDEASLPESFESAPAPPDSDSAPPVAASMHGDPAELARRLERLADRLRMQGSNALDESREAADPMEAALAAALADLLEQRGH